MGELADGSEVERLALTNPTDTVFLLPGGVVFDGGWQHRVLVRSVLVDARSELDLDRLTQFGNTAPEFRGQAWDPQNRYSIPYLWGVTGIASDARLVPKVDSWNALLDPRWKGKILMLDDAREAVAFGAFQ